MYEREEISYGRAKIILAKFTQVSYIRILMLSQPLGSISFVVTVISKDTWLCNCKKTFAKNLVVSDGS